MAPETVDLLINADFLFSIDGKQDVVAGAEIAIRDGRIVYAGPAQEPARWQPREKLDARGMACLPGFVNCHCHTASTVFRSQTDDGLGGLALYTIGFRGEGLLTPEDWRLLAPLGVAEMILAGFTTLNDFWHAPDAMGDIALATGLRLQLASEIFDVNKSALADGDYRHDPRQGERRLRDGVDVATRWHGRNDGLITTRLGPHATDTCAAGLHREIAEEASRLGVGLHCHVAQSRPEVERIRAIHGKGPASWLAELGVLGASSVLAHLTFADDDDLNAIAETGASYAHCATIYPRRGVYPRLNTIRSQGITTGLATDWMQNDPFEAMRNALNAIRILEGRHDALSTGEALEMATAGAARAMGLSNQIGRLAPGMDADIILIDIDQAHLQPFYGSTASLVYNARASDVRTSLVRGRIVMQDRVINGLDINAALASVKAQAPHWGQLMNDLGGESHLPNCPCGMH